MAKNSKQRHESESERALKKFNAGYEMVFGHPMFSPFRHRVITWSAGKLCPCSGWAVVTNHGAIHAYALAHSSPAEWAYVFAHSLLHLAMGHFKEEKEHPREWNTACDLIVARFLADLKLGRSPQGTGKPEIGAGQTEETLYRRFCVQGIPKHLIGFGTAGPHHNDMVWQPEQEHRHGSKKPGWEYLFGVGLKQAVSLAVDVAGGKIDSLHGQKLPKQSVAQSAKSWFTNSFPLLGSLAVAFDIIEDTLICQCMKISVAAVNPEAQEMFVNPAAGLTEDECCFVMAHELLHVGLRHHARREGRDPYYWNVACDFVINSWLVEMGIGSLPQFGGLYEPEFKNESAEAIYDRIVNDMRRFRKLATLRGRGLCDMLEPNTADWWKTREGVTLDDFYRRCLGQGLIYHEQYGRGFLPAGLIEEIRAMSQPPIPWDVELARWFDQYFTPLEKYRTYARPSRRQSSTPDIPRPRWVEIPDAEDGRTFGVVLDTSGSMDRVLLAKALGAIASYSIAHDVPAVRVIFCDAAPYDQGYMVPESIADRVHVKGRGGTVLQPGIDLLEKADDFPRKGPILIITDGWCEHLRVRREHAFLIPDGHYLPFQPRGKVFKIK